MMWTNKILLGVIFYSICDKAHLEMDPLIYIKILSESHQTGPIRLSLFDIYERFDSF